MLISYLGEQVSDFVVLIVNIILYMIIISLIVAFISIMLIILANIYRYKNDKTGD